MLVKIILLMILLTPLFAIGCTSPAPINIELIDEGVLSSFTLNLTGAVFAESWGVFWTINGHSYVANDFRENECLSPTDTLPMHPCYIALT
jgi:hypothetical protein